MTKKIDLLIKRIEYVLICSYLEELALSKYIVEWQKEDKINDDLGNVMTRATIVLRNSNRLHAVEFLRILKILKK